MAEDTLATKAVGIAGVLNRTSYNVSYNEGTIFDSEPQYDESFVIVMKVEKYCLPIICALGLIGNTLSTITFLRKPLRKSPCSLYLAARGISDNGFLLSLLLIWTSGTFNLKLSAVKGVCQFTIFLTYVCGCVSVWLCVFITFENFLLIQFPYVARRLCSNISRICIAVLLFLSVGVYNISLWIINEDCSHNPSFSSLTQILVYSDTLLTLVIPTVIIFVLLSVITCRILKIMHVRKLHDRVVEKLTNTTSKRSILPIAKVTKMLFVFSCMFFVLNVPSHVIRLMLLIGTFTKGQNTAPFVQATIQVIFQLLYYLSFSINIFVYAICGSNFRKVFRKTLCRCIRKPHTTYTQTEAINLVRRRRHSLNVCGAEKYGEGKDSNAYLMLSDQQKHLQSCS